jgi:arylsulfatase A-like enzyme
MMVRHPQGQAAGTRYDGLVYNHDLTATLYSLIDIKPQVPLDGFDFWPRVLAADQRAREHVTVAWGPLVTVVTDEWWYNASIWGEGELLYAVRDDPDLEASLAEENPAICRDLLALAVEDAGGTVPEALAGYHNKPGCTPFEDRSDRSAYWGGELRR